MTQQHPSLLTESKAWHDLQHHANVEQIVHLKTLFAEDPLRPQKFSIQAAGLDLDFSRNWIEERTLKLLEKLLQNQKFDEKRQALVSGQKWNHTEGRAALHTALRDKNKTPLEVDGLNVPEAVQVELDKMRSFVESVYRGSFVGHTQKKIKYVINIGIGGSDLGPYMVTEALKPFIGKDSPKVLFVSNVDGSHLYDALAQVNLDETLFLIASKTFATQETMMNAMVAKQKLIEFYNGDESAVAHHFIALSTNDAEVVRFGINPQYIFRFWDWVGGRYSIWSTIGMSIALAVGFENFEKLQKGAFEMDQHFLTAEPTKNMPVVLALLGVWYNNFLGWQSHAIIPYIQNLHRFPAFLQQLDMESNGKSVDRDGHRVDYQTGQTVWGEPGANGQHAFFQLIHQGTKMISSDFILAAKPFHESDLHHRVLIANFVAQTEALMNGLTREQVDKELASLSAEERIFLAPHKVFEGNRPSNTILMERLTPETLGALIALYEHKVFVQGVIWNVNSFDQYGVELGKKLAKTVLSELESGVVGTSHDSSTASVLSKIIEMRAR
jgi:glucose-6-phosphate isomerase